MKNILKTTTLLITGFILFASCDESRYRKYFNVKNNSGKLIYWGVSHSYPDTSLKSIVNVPGKNTANKIYPGDIYAFTMSMFSRNPTVQLFIFDKDVIENTPWDTIVKYNMILKHYQFTESELEKMSWPITYDEN